MDALDCTTSYFSKVQWAHLILAFTTPTIQQLGLVEKIKLRCCHIPSLLSEDEGLRLNLTLRQLQSTLHRPKYKKQKAQV